MDSAMGFSDMTRRGFPHSDICVSTPACGSTQLIAANHVLRRLLTPRHPPSALSSLTTSLSRSIGKLDSLRCRGSKSLGCCLAPLRMTAMDSGRRTALALLPRFAQETRSGAASLSMTANRILRLPAAKTKPSARPGLLQTDNFRIVVLLPVSCLVSFGGGRHGLRLPGLLDIVVDHVL